MTYQGAFAALADPTRRAVFEALGSGPKAVSEVAARLPVSRPAVSQHLKVLRNAGLVQVARSGNRRLYRLEATGLGELRTYLERYWDVALQAFKDVADAHIEEDA